MALTPVAGGQPIRSTHVTQFYQWVTGARKDQSAAFTTTHATEYTVTVTNEETSAGNALKVVSGSSTIALFNKTGVTFSVPITSTNVLLTTLFQTAGDLLGASAASTPVRIPKGTAWQSLTMNSAATGQTWASCLLALVQTAGDLAVGSGLNAITRLAKGSDGTFLGVSSGSVVWADLPAGSLPASDGTASAPTISFSAQTSTGLYRATANTIGVASNGAAALTLAGSATGGLVMGTNVPIVPAALSGTMLAHGLYQGNVVKGWANLAGTDGTLNASFNVTSITDNGASGMTVTWNRDFSSDQFACVATPLETPGGTAATTLVCMVTNTSGTSIVYTHRVSDGAHVDPARLAVIAIGNQ